MITTRKTVNDIIYYYKSLIKGNCIYFPAYCSVPEKVINNTLRAHHILNLNDIYFISDVHKWGKESFLLTYKGISITTEYHNDPVFIDWGLIQAFQFDGNNNLQIIYDKEFSDHSSKYPISVLFDKNDALQKYLLENLYNFLKELLFVNNIIESDDIKGIFKIASIHKSYAIFDFGYIIKKSTSLLQKSEFNKVIEISKMFYESIDKVAKMVEGYNEIKNDAIRHMKFIEAQAQEKIDNYLKAYNCYLQFYNSMPEKYSDFNGNEMTKYDIKNIIYNISRKTNENVLNYDYEDRKMIVTTKELPLVPTETCLITLDTNFKDIEFIPYFEKGNNTIYIAHPLKNNVYINKNDYDNHIIQEKQQELLNLIQCLGAKKVDIIQKESTLNRSKEHTKTEAGVDVKRGPIEVGGGGLIEKKTDTEINADKNFKWHRDFKPIAKPYIPNNLIWYKQEPRWQDIAERRMNGGIINDGREIVLKASDYFSSQDKFKLNADLKIVTTRIKGFYSSEKDTLDESEIMRYLKVNIEYYSEEELPNNILKHSQTEQLKNPENPRKDNFVKRIIDFIKKLLISK